MFSDTSQSATSIGRVCSISTPVSFPSFFCSGTVSVSTFASGSTRFAYQSAKLANVLSLASRRVICLSGVCQPVYGVYRYNSRY